MFNTITEAIKEIEQGRMIIVCDNENRENEGDFIMSAQTCTPLDINFMIKEGRGLVCAPISKKIAKKLKLPLMVINSNDSHQTAFTLSVDAKDGITTGISVNDRARALNLLGNIDSSASDFVMPGHIFPLIAKDGGVEQRAGHTEAAVDLALLAGHSPAGVICEILNDDGSCARVPDLKRLATKFELKMISIDALIEYKKKNKNVKKVEVDNE